MLETNIRDYKKVTIMGFAPSWTDTKFDDPDMEIWTLNEAYQLLEQAKVPVNRVGRWFEIHNPYSPSKNIEAHHKFLKELPMPLIMNKMYEEFPTCVEYPREEIKKYFNENFIIDDVGSEFTEFSNSISWMVAMAIHEGYNEIHITGVDMAQKDEYAWQRSSCNFFIGYAAGKGIKILIPKTSELCKFPQDYGFNTDNQTRIKMKSRKKELKDRKKMMLVEIQKHQQNIKNYEIGVAQIDGAISEIDYNLNNHIV